MCRTTKARLRGGRTCRSQLRAVQSQALCAQALTVGLNAQHSAHHVVVAAGAGACCRSPGCTIRRHHSQPCATQQITKSLSMRNNHSSNNVTKTTHAPATKNEKSQKWHPRNQGIGTLSWSNFFVRNSFGATACTMSGRPETALRRAEGQSGLRFADVRL